LTQGVLVNPVGKVPYVEVHSHTHSFSNKEKFWGHDEVGTRRTAQGIVTNRAILPGLFPQRKRFFRAVSPVSQAG
jgi:hypothetical protein